jgi:hypothetical protein
MRTGLGKLFALSWLCGLLVAAPAAGQPALDTLWPNDDGLRFAYRYTWHDAMLGLDHASAAYLQLEGTALTAGGEAQVLLAEHGDLPAAARAGDPGVGGLLGLVWRARPDLRPALAGRVAAAKDAQAMWRPNLLHGGFFLKSAAAVQMWQEDWNHATWTYLTGDLTPGATFVHQLLPELADDIFLHGTVGAVGVGVTTLAGSFEDAVRVDYLIDLGLATNTDEMGELVGVVHAEVRGHVHYVPDVGPVELLEEFLPYVTVDCGENDCPPEWTAWLGQVVRTQTLSLSQAPVPTADASWGGVKSLYR